MADRVPPLNWLKAFEAAARHQNFAAAARELNMTQPAVSYQVRSLEGRLGASLFERHARRVELTDLGHAYLPSVLRAFAELSASTAGLFGVSGQRELTVRCAAAFAMLWLSPRLHRFHARHPNITLRLYTSTWAEAGEADPADVDIRYGDGTWPARDVALLHREHAIPVCAPARLADLGTPPSAEACARQNLVHIMGYETLWRSWFRHAGVAELPPWRGIKVDNSIAALELAASGFGLALVFETFARPYLDAGRLVAPLQEAHESEQAHYLVLPEKETPRPDEAWIFRDWCLSEARAESR